MSNKNTQSRTRSRDLSGLVDRTDYGRTGTGRATYPVPDDVPDSAYPTAHVIGRGYVRGVRMLADPEGARLVEIDVVGDAERLIVHWHRGL